MLSKAIHAIQGVQKEEMTGSLNKNVSEHGCEMLMEAAVQRLNKPRLFYVEMEMSMICFQLPSSC